MAVDGNWNISVETPIGSRQASLTLSTAGGALTGTQAADGSSTEIADGKVDGNAVSWRVDITNPMPLTLEFKGTVEGDKISGHAEAGVSARCRFQGHGRRQPTTQSRDWAVSRLYMIWHDLAQLIRDTIAPIFNPQVQWPNPRRSP